MKAVDTHDRVLARAYAEAVRMLDQQKAAGMSFLERMKGFTAVIRDVWPKGRDEPWRYICDACEDTGWQYDECLGDATCGRVKRHLAHSYVRICWCAKGRAMTPKPKEATDELAAVGKVTKPSRFGR